MVDDQWYLCGTHDHPGRVSMYAFRNESHSIDGSESGPVIRETTIPFLLVLAACDG